MGCREDGAPCSVQHFPSKSKHGFPIRWPPSSTPRSTLTPLLCSYRGTSISSPPKRIQVPNQPPTSHHPFSGNPLPRESRDKPAGLRWPCWCWHWLGVRVGKSPPSLAHCWLSCISPRFSPSLPSSLTSWGASISEPASASLLSLAFLWLLHLFLSSP